MLDMLLVNPESLQTKANEVKKLKARHDETVTTIRNIIRSLGNEWGGAAQEELVAQFEAMQGAFDKFSNSLGEYGNAMKKSATELKNIDEQAGRYFDKLD